MESAELSHCKQLMKSVDFFTPFNDKEIEILLESTHIEKYAKGELIIKEHVREDFFFILLRGKASIVKKGKESALHKVARLKPGDCFGEIAVLLDEPRSASIMALEECFVVNIKIISIDKLVIEIREKLYRQFAVSLAKRLKFSSTMPKE